MRHMMQWLAALVLLLVPALAWPMQPLPLAREAASNAAFGAPLKGLLEDYVNLLPAQTSLRITEPDKGYMTHSWSSNYDALAHACRADQASCDTLLRTQFDLLLAELNDPKTEGGLRKVLLLAAEYDLCKFGSVEAMGYRCSSPNLVTMVSMGWNMLGYEHLFLGYQDADMAYRNQWNAWVEAQTDYTPEQKQASLKRTERDPGAPARDAQALELRGGMTSAYTGWGILLYQNMDKPETALQALTQLARLAAWQGEGDAASQWWQLAENLLAEHHELQQSGRCLLKVPRFSLDLLQAKLARTPFDGPQRIRELIDLNCNFTEQALYYAFQQRDREPEQVLAVLKMAQQSCNRGSSCAYDRQWQIGKWLTILQGDAATLRAESQYWLGRLKHQDLTAGERKLVWLLADHLHQSKAVAESAELYRELDASVEFMRSQLRFKDAVDVAQFDDLKRIRVQTDLELGKEVMPAETESLRGQSLLQRLRLQRWSKELANVQDAAARAERDTQLQNIRTLRAAMTPETVAAMPPLNQAVAKFMLADAARNEQEIQLAYLDKLASKKLKDEGGSGWGGLETYRQSQESLWVAPGVPFDKDEAYLSWLRVPGGYIGILLGTDPRKPDHYLYGAHNNVRQLFIPFSSHDEAVLQLYRDLLQSGGSMQRGFRRTAPIETDGGGLKLAGLPVWQLADGSFTTGQQTPAGARRVQNFAELGDALYERLLAPFASAFQDTRRLIISPDGALSYLPFETLTRKGVPVLEITDIGYVQSQAVYAELKKRVTGDRKQPSVSLLSVADPQYSSLEGATGQAQGLENIRWPALPGTRKESDAITGLFRNSRQLLGADASKSKLSGMQDALADFRVLHFATHGYVDDQHSALVLSPASTPVSAYLMDQDIAGWKLSSDLVLLSACNTGIGRQQTGEGIVGLPYAFFMAGNINTLMSLWPVDDEGTAKLMPAFMQRIRQGEDHVSALNDTKRAFARGEYGEAFKNPRIWAAFVLYGVPLERGQ